MSDGLFPNNALLRDRLIQLIPETDGAPEIVSRGETLQDWTGPVDVVVSAGEINNEHGTGPLVKRVFKGRRGIFSVRCQDNWGIHDFGDWHVKIPLITHTRYECFREVIRILRNREVRSVTCVPFTADELFVSIAIKEVFAAKLCGWIMDDQNVAVNHIPDALMREFLEKCSLRLTTHPELRDAYRRKYGLPVHILPAVAPGELVALQPVEPPRDYRKRSGVLLGSFWDQTWFNRLCSVLEHCESSIDWYGQNKSPWLRFPPEDLTRAGIQTFGVIPEERLAIELRKYPFVIVPVGALDEKEMNKGVAALSLPGRILFAAATSHTPILIVGSNETCGARFVKRFGIGMVAPYEAARVAAAMDRLSDPKVQRELRGNAAAIAPLLSDRGVVDWLAASIELGAPVDRRFEDAFSTDTQAEAL